MGNPFRRSGSKDDPFSRITPEEETLGSIETNQNHLRIVALYWSG
jgi:hypothetical protein